MLSVVERIKQEKKDLDEKYEKLTEFLGSEQFTYIPEREKHLMYSQSMLMSSYSVVLGLRLKLHEEEKANE